MDSKRSLQDGSRFFFLPMLVVPFTICAEDDNDVLGPVEEASARGAFVAAESLAAGASVDPRSVRQSIAKP